MNSLSNQIIDFALNASDFAQNMDWYNFYVDQKQEINLSCIKTS